MTTLGTLRATRLAGALIASALGIATNTASAVPVTVTGAFHTLENRSVNSVNVAPGIRQQFGATSVVPNGAAGTTGRALQGNLNLLLNFTPFDTLPDFFTRSRDAATTPDGQWLLRFTNGTDVTQVLTPSIAGGVVMPFVTNTSITGGPAPTFNWTLPSGAPIDGIRIIIRDTTDLRGTGGVGGTGVANIIYSQGFAANTTSFTVNPSDPNLTQPLVQNRQYSLQVNLRDLRNPSGGTGVANTLSESSSFFDFQLLPSGGPGQVFLPMIDTSGPVPVHHFQPIPVVAGQLIFIDPLVAVGYDYQIGSGNPNIASVLMPEVGDNSFDLWLWDGIKWFDTTVDLLAGIEHFFGPGGVDRFRITGIEQEAGIDPFSATAFITGVSFVADGFFSGTMTPLVVDVAQIPEPSTLLLFLAGLGIAGWRGRYCRSA
jgi:hypothetical protein